MAPEVCTEAPVSDLETELRLHIVLLEKEAIAKKKAADLAIQSATLALKEVKKEEEAVSGVGSSKDSPTSEATSSIAQMIATAEKEVESSPEAAETRQVESPPTIFRQAEIPQAPVSPVKPDPDPEVVQFSTIDQDVVSPLRQATSNLSMQDDTNNSNRRDHSEMMETTLDYLMDKIENCTAVLSDPDASVEEHVEAAKLVKGYAAAAKAFHSAV
jgi:hypothetical protein